MMPQLLTLVYELLDAHEDTTRLASTQQLDARWSAHITYLRDLQRVAHELLAHSAPPPRPQEADPDAIDAIIDTYVSWREACAEVASSYQRWRVAERRHEMIAWSVYAAALDREEWAAICYQRAVERVAAGQPRRS